MDSAAATKLHPLVARTAAGLRKAKPDDNELLGCPAGFYVRVAPESLDRAIDVLATVVDAMTGAGLSFRIGEDKRPVFLFEGTQFCVEVREDRTRKDYLPTKQERQRMAEDVFFRPKRFTYELHQSLTVGFGEPSKFGRRSVLTVCHTDDLSNIASEIPVRLERVMSAIRERRAENERRRKQQEESARANQEQQARQREETARIKQLEDFMARWRKAKEIREFLAAVIRARWPIRAGSRSDELLKWATAYADSLDPLRIEEP